MTDFNVPSYVDRSSDAYANAANTLATYQKIQGNQRQLDADSRFATYYKNALQPDGTLDQNRLNAQIAEDSLGAYMQGRVENALAIASANRENQGYNALAGSLAKRTNSAGVPDYPAVRNDLAVGGNGASNAFNVAGVNEAADATQVAIKKPDGSTVFVPAGTANATLSDEAYKQTTTDPETGKTLVKPRDGVNAPPVDLDALQTAHQHNDILTKIFDDLRAVPDLSFDDIHTSVDSLIEQGVITPQGAAEIYKNISPTDDSATLQAKIQRYEALHKTDMDNLNKAYPNPNTEIKTEGQKLLAGNSGTQSAGQTEQITKNVEDTNNVINSYKEKAQTASSTIPVINKALTELDNPNLKTGPFSDQVHTLAAILSEGGLLPKNLADETSTIEQLKKNLASIKVAPELNANLAGVVKNLDSANPDMNLTIQGIREILKQNRALLTTDSIRNAYLQDIDTSKPLNRQQTNQKLITAQKIDPNIIRFLQESQTDPQSAKELKNKFGKDYINEGIDALDKSGIGKYVH